MSKTANFEISLPSNWKYLFLCVIKAAVISALGTAHNRCFDLQFIENPMSKLVKI